MGTGAGKIRDIKLVESDLYTGAFEVHVGIKLKGALNWKRLAFAAQWNEAHQDATVGILILASQQALQALSGDTGVRKTQSSSIVANQSKILCDCSIALESERIPWIERVHIYLLTRGLIGIGAPT